MGAKRTVKHSVDWGIIEHETGWLGGSRHLLNLSYGRRTAQILMDIGGNQIWWNQTEEDKINNFTPLRNIDVNTLDSMIITHVHQDHNGDIVFAPQWWYPKEIIMTETSKQLTDIITRDNLKTQWEEKSATNKRLKEEWDLIRKAVYTTQMNLGVGKTRSKKPNTHHTIPLAKAKEIVAKYKIQVSKIKSEADLIKYKPEFKKREFNDEDVRILLKQIKTVDYNQEFTVVKDFVKGKFYNAWHIEWSAQVLLKVMGNLRTPKNTMNVLYTWDLGRSKQPGKAWEPEIPTERIDYLIIEWTYWDKVHLDREQQRQKFISQINSAKWLVLIPAFALQRFQEVIDMLGEAVKNKELSLHSGEKIYCHSNLAYDISKEYLAHDINNKYPHLRRSSHIKWLAEQDEINGIMHSKGRRIIIVSGWMLENGSIMQYLHYATQSHNAQILTTWFQAPWTIGNRLARNDFSQPIIVNDKQITSNKAAMRNFSFSGHADQEELISYISKLKLSRYVQIAIVHGWIQRYALEQKIAEVLQNRDLKKSLAMRWLWKIHVPEKNGTEIIVNEPENMNP